MRYLVLPAILLAAACSKNSEPPSPGLFPTAATGDPEIIFITQQYTDNAEWQLMRIRPDGSGGVLLTDKFVRCAPPVPSNSTGKIAFTTLENNEYRLYSIDRTGANLRLLATSGNHLGSPIWSPDDNSLLIVKPDPDNLVETDIYSIDLNSLNETRLTFSGKSFSPAFAGERIIYSNSGTIYSMDADGKNQKQLTKSNKRLGMPVISPDNKRVALVSAEATGSQIYVMNIDGSGLKQLTFTAAPFAYPGYPPDGNGNPAWSPDGTRLAYESYESGNLDVFVINANGTGKKQLTNAPIRDEWPRWTRDGNQILFSSNRNLQLSSKIYTMKPNGDDQKPLTNVVGADIYPALLGK